LPATGAPRCRPVRADRSRRTDRRDGSASVGRSGWPGRTSRRPGRLATAGGIGPAPPPTAGPWRRRPDAPAPLPPATRPPRTRRRRPPATGWSPRLLDFVTGDDGLDRAFHAGLL